MKYSELRDYFQSMAEDHQDLKHHSSDVRFYTFGITEMLQTQSDLPGDGYILNYETPENDFQGGSDDFPHKDRTAAFSILTKVSDADPVAMMDAMDECEEIGDEILRKINQDSNDSRNEDPDVGTLAAMISSFELRRVKSFPVGPILNNFFGIRYELSLSSEFTTAINEEKWG